MIPEEVETIHRLLGSSFRNEFRHSRKNPLVLDCVVIDEASMIDLPLMAKLLDALPGDARIILLGDRDQLSSVEAGNVLGDITGHGENIIYSIAQRSMLASMNAAPEAAIPATPNPPAISDAVGLLHKSYRFSSHSGIAKLASQVNSGQGREAFDLVTQGSYEDLVWLNAHQDQLNPRCLEWAVERYSKYLEEDDIQKALFLYEQYRVLSALHHGSFGIEHLNQEIAARLQDQGLIRGGREYHGKPVMVTVNDYEINLFNGDIGLLWRDGNDGLRAWFPAGRDTPRSVSVRQLPQHECAFALTVHKSQGSEFDEVMLVLPDEMNRILSRELVYTGITRAQTHVTIQGNPEVFVEACQRRVERTSGLGPRLGWH
jgi:exodeoxyribonuclease V alpha subunit